MGRRRQTPVAALACVLLTGCISLDHGPIVAAPARCKDHRLSLQTALAPADWAIVGVVSRVTVLRSEGDLLMGYTTARAVVQPWKVLKGQPPHAPSFKFTSFYQETEPFVIGQPFDRGDAVLVRREGRQVIGAAVACVDGLELPNQSGTIQ